MTLSHDRQKVFCHICHTWLIIRTETYLEGDNILCLKDDGHLGYVWDLPEMFLESGGGGHSHGETH